MKPTVFPSILTLITLAACSDSYSPTDPGPQVQVPTTFAAIGDSAIIAAKLDQFRGALGGARNGGTVPPQASGRREINWDGVPAAFTNVDTFPAFFFNVNVKLGAVFTTPGTGFRTDSTNFGSANASYGSQFQFFSTKKTFMPVGSNKLDVHFQLAGSPVPAVVKGFGVIFSDVDRAGSARVEFFDIDGARLAVIEAPARTGTKEFAFVGAVFANSIVARVRITSGQASLSGTLTDLSDGGSNDLVVMDDFIYGEPQPTPQ